MLLKYFQCKNFPIPRTTCKSCYSVVFKPVYIWKIMLYCQVTAQCNLQYLFSLSFKM